MNPLVTLIIPAYNCENYIEQTLQSVINQTYRNIEILLVDDGSTDTTGKICDVYSKKDERVVVYHKENGGQASARNLALADAKGEYLAFADSDDILALNYIETLINLAIKYNSDFVQCGYSKFWDQIPEHAYEEKNDIAVLPSSEALKEFCYQRKITPAPWCKIIKRSTWGDIRFPVGMGYEDYAIIYKVLGNAQKIVCSSTGIYLYRIHNSSTQHTAYSDRKKDRIRIADELMDYVNKNYPELAEAAKARVCLAQLQYLMELPFGSTYKDEKKQSYMKLKKYRNQVIGDKNVKIVLRLMLLCSYMGADCLMVLGRLYAICTRR